MKKYFPFLILISFSLLAFSVGNIFSLKTLILSKLYEYNSLKYPEKIYVHTDKPYYTAGEDIWFSAYLVNGVTHLESSKSSVIYVDLLDEKDSIISQRKIFVESINAEGDFKLPMTLNEGIYSIRAYTNYMHNESKEFFFKKEILIYSLYANDKDTEKNRDSTSVENLEIPIIGFYPEGGYLVSGLKNKMAIKIEDADLESPSVNGIIEDNEGNKITDFHTFEFGLGYFYLKPELGKEYRAIISSDNEKISYKLPTPLSQGFVMNTSISEKELIIELSTNKQEGLKNTLVIGQQRGIPVFDYIENKNKNTVLLRIPKSYLTEGILDIVLFDGSKKPVAERMMYVKKENEIIISVKKTNGIKSISQDKVDLKIDVKNSLGETVNSSLSLSVTNADMIDMDENSGNIRTYLLLNSDLRGEIKSPNYFFTAGDEVKKNAQLDLIMMTHGWRRFDWVGFLEDPLWQKFKPEDGIYISGRTISSTTPFGHKKSETKLTLSRGGFYQEMEKTDKYGRFSYGPFVFNDTITILFQAAENLSLEKPDFLDFNIVFDAPTKKPQFTAERSINPFTQKIIENETYREKSRNYIFREFKFEKDRELLDEVLVTAKVKTKEELKNIERNKRTRSFQPSHRVIVDENEMNGSNNLTELIANIPGIKIGADRNGGVLINLRGMLPSFYLDDIKVDIMTALSIPQANIDFIDVLNTGHASAAYALEAQGVIAIYSRRGSREGGKSEKKPGSITFKSAGFYSARSFYAPDDSNENSSRIKMNDRSTLYWNPKLTIQPSKKTEVTFYKNGQNGKYQIRVEGMTDSGIPIYTTAILEADK